MYPTDLDKVCMQAQYLEEDGKQIRQYENSKGVGSSGQQEKGKTQDKGKKNKQEKKNATTTKSEKHFSHCDKDRYDDASC